MATPKSLSTPEDFDMMAKQTLHSFLIMSKSLDNSAASIDGYLSTSRTDHAKGTVTSFSNQVKETNDMVKQSKLLRSGFELFVEAIDNLK
jgi:hypothetical protein